MKYGQSSLPEGLDEDLYGHLCPELDWLTEEEMEKIMSGNAEKEVSADGLAK